MKKLLLAFALLSTFLCVSANQDPQMNYSLNNYAQTGGVIGGNMGFAYAADGYFKDLADNTHSTNGNIAIGGLFGFDYALHDYFSLGAETGIQYDYKVIKLQAPKNNHGRVDIISVPLMVVGKYYIPYANGLNVFGKTGYAYNHVILEANGQEVTKNLYRPVCAVGIGYKIKDVTVFFQYQYNWLDQYGYRNTYAVASGGVSYVLGM